MEAMIQKTIESEELERLRHQISALCSQGAAYVCQENLAAAEQAYLGALNRLRQLRERTGDAGYGDSAGELCEILVDINMQQGNMHGADRYYVEARCFRNGEDPTGAKNRGEQPERCKYGREMPKDLQNGF